MRRPLRLCSRLRRLAGVVALSSLGLASAAHAGDQTVRPVEDPHYGDTLYHFFQGRYFSAVTGLMASQHFERVPHHADEAEVLRGGLLLSYGLHREAGDIFAKLIDKGASPSVRDRAWYYLAKIRYQRGLLAEAQEAIARIGKPLPGELEDERVLLQSNVLLAMGDHAGAAKLLQGVVAKPGASQYARFNLGVALVKSGDAEAGAKLLDQIGKAPAADEEARSLRDKANVALGFAALQDERADDARSHLERVRLKSTQSNKALLGFGWAAASLKKHELALVPWTELAERDASDASVLEARIAVPYAYAELGAYGQSLRLYQQAIEAFEREGKALDESIAAIRSGKLVQGLAELNPGEEMGWLGSIRELPEMPHAGHLTPLLAQHEFQEAFKNWRDLQFLARNLQRWQETLGVYGDMLSNRKQAYAQRLPKIVSESKTSRNGLLGLQQRRAEVAQALAHAESANDGVALADAKECELLQRLESVRAALEEGGSDPELAEARERYRRVAGAITWRLAEQQPVRLWEAKKSLKLIDQQLAEAQARDAALVQAQRDEPARFERFAVRIAELSPRIQAMQPRVASLSREQEAALQDLTVAELTRQKERLAQYTAQARFAVAQLYDRAQTKGGDEHASR